MTGAVQVAIDQNKAIAFLNDLGWQLGPEQTPPPAWGATRAGALTRQFREGAAARVRFNLEDFWQALAGQGMRAEVMAAALLNEPAIQNYTYPAIVLGARAAQVRALPAGPGRDYYLAIQGLMRWYPEAIEVPRANDAIFIPPPPTPIIGGNTALVSQVVQAGVLVVVGVVGVAAACAAATAWWASKRDDSKAAVELGTVRGVAAAEQAGAAIVAQIAAGKTPDPALVEVLHSVGNIESTRGWSGYLAAGASGVAIALGGALAYGGTK